MLQISQCGELNGRVLVELIPIQIKLPIKCTQISCGKRHSLGLLEGNFVISWGTGFFGQLGLGDDKAYHSPQLIHSLDPNRLGDKVFSVVCGGFHSGVITERGNIFMFGLNRNGQCGTSPTNDTLLDPTYVDLSMLPKNTRPSSLVCGRSHSILLTNEGRLYSWGACGFGRLGLPDLKKKQTSPCLIVSLRLIEIFAVAAGDFHTVALDENGTVYSWGCNSEGQCGLNSLHNVRTPQRIDELDDKGILSIHCGSNWSIAISQNGNMYGWGYDDGHWLGLYHQYKLKYPNNISTLPCYDPESCSGAQSKPDLLCTFDANFCVTKPKLIKGYFKRHVVRDVRCGGSHTIIFCSEAADAERRQDSMDCSEGKLDSEDEDDVEDTAPGKRYTYI